MIQKYAKLLILITSLILILVTAAQAELPIDKVFFKGNTLFSNKRLQKLLRIERIDDYHETHLRADLKTIFELYRRYGYLQAKKVESTDILTRDNKRHYTIVISEGRQTRLGNLRIRPDEDVIDSLLLANFLSLKSGDPYSQILIEQQKQDILNAYANAGYVYATLRDSATFSADRFTANLILTVETGICVKVRAIQVSGNRKVRDRIILRELETTAGSTLNLNLIQQDQQRLYGTGLFRDVRLILAGFEEKQPEVDLVIKVVEEKLRWIGGGIGYGTLDGGRLSAEYGHDNLFDNAQKLQLKGILTDTDVIKSDAFFRIHRALELKYVDPRLFQYRWTSGLDLNYSYENNRDLTELAHRLEIVGARVATGRTIRRYNQVSFQIGWRMDTYFDVDTTGISLHSEIQQGRTITNSFGISLSRDTRNDVFNPVRGYNVFVSTRIGGFLLRGDNDFIRYHADLSAYRRIKGLILSARVQAGQVNSYGDTYLIEPTDQFAYGGNSTNRGYRENALGSTNHRGTKSGNALVAGSLELRLPFFTYFQFVIFGDYGRLWFTTGEVNRARQGGFSISNDPLMASERLSGGLGLRYFTPVGPLRIDWGYPVDFGDQFNRHTGRMFISFGQSF